MALLLDIEPNDEILLERHPGMSSAGFFRLHNGKAGNIAFKVKTTKPELYLVSPNQGILAPGTAIRVQVTLKILPRELSELSHRFCIVQSRTDLKPGDDVHLAEFWGRANLDLTQQVLKAKLAELGKAPEPPPSSPVLPKKLPPRSHRLQSPEATQFRDFQRLLQGQSSDLASFTHRLESLRLELRRKDAEEESDSSPAQGWSWVHIATAVLLGFVFGRVSFCQVV